jgi:hypothetical protein
LALALGAAHGWDKVKGSDPCAAPLDCQGVDWRSRITNIVGYSHWMCDPQRPSGGSVHPRALRESDRGKTRQALLEASHRLCQGRPLHPLGGYSAPLLAQPHNRMIMNLTFGKPPDTSVPPESLMSVSQVALNRLFSMRIDVPVFFQLAREFLILE